MVLEHLGIDYCCGGDRTLEAACAELGLTPAEVLKALEEADRAKPTEVADGSTLTVAGLIDDIIRTHHEFLRRALPEISKMATKVVHAHGEAHPEMIQIREVFEPFHLDLEQHLNREELVVFPTLREMEASGREPESGITDPIDTLRHEHRDAGATLRRLRELAGGYQAPADTCTTVRAFYQALEELEADLHLHIHKENNLLFPMVEKKR